MIFRMWLTRNFVVNSIRQNIRIRLPSIDRGRRANKTRTIKTIIFLLTHSPQNDSIFLWDSEREKRVDGVTTIPPWESSHEKFPNHNAATDIRIGRNLIKTKVGEICGTAVNRVKAISTDQ